MAEYLDIDVNMLADWLERQSEDRLWAVDGDARISERVSLPCPGQDLAAVLRKLGGQVRVTAQGQHPNSNDLASYAGVEAGAPIFEIAWVFESKPGTPFYLLEDTEAERIVRETLEEEQRLTSAMR